MTKKVLALSDIVLDMIYSPMVRTRFADVDLIIGCGDLPYYYLEYAMTAINKPLFFVRGNHSSVIEHTSAGPQEGPLGAVDLHRRVIVFEGLLIGGIEGSLRYRSGPFQYSDTEMWWYIIGLIPALLRNQILHGRYLDVFVTHAPPWGIHDQPDLPHHGIKAFRWFLKVFKPAYHLHGHIHVYKPDTVTNTRFFDTQVINTYGYVETIIEPVKRGPSLTGVFQKDNGAQNPDRSKL
jgi:Icc-related predicted phosphoesterase